LKKTGWIAALLLCLACFFGACAEPLSFALPAGNASLEICTAEIEAEEETTQWLFLPAFADPDALGLEWLEEEADEEGVRRADMNGETLHVMQSENLRALFLFSDDPVNQGREYIENSEKRSKTQTTGSIAVITPDGTVDYAGELRQLRGRGNFTWTQRKRPYQFKLEERADLLKTGDPSESARTWVLLAEYLDASMLHNRITLDLALELGMEETSRSEFVDLYYDGEYRGMYLLAEKVEIDPARIDERDYDKLIETWNRQAGIHDLEALGVFEGENRFGSRFTSIENLQDSGMVNAGAYLLEMEDEVGTLSDRCWFRMSDGSLIALKSPENASEPMVRYISEKLESARSILQSGGEGIEEAFDVDAFALTALLCELGYSRDSFRYSSTFFVLPAGADRFEPGPVWDFDLGWRYYRTGINDDGVGTITQEGWLPEFYSVPLFVERMREIYLSRVYPLVQDILLGETQRRYLQPLDSYAAHIAQARRMNDRLWEPEHYAHLNYALHADGETELLRAFIAERSEWLRQAMSHAHPDAITLWGYASYTYVPDRLFIQTCPWDKARVRSFEAEQLTEATEDSYARWQLDIVLEPKEGTVWDEPSVFFNATPLRCEKQADGSLLVRVVFEDLSYRPVDYYGEDIGLVYNPDVYAANYPEIAAEYEDDPEGLMDYFCDEGMYEGQMGNAFFDPEEVEFYHYELSSTLGEDWQMYYWDYIAYGHEYGWLLNTLGEGRGFALQVSDAL